MLGRGPLGCGSAHLLVREKGLSGDRAQRDAEGSGVSDGLQLIGAGFEQGVGGALNVLERAVLLTGKDLCHEM
jgi:hypothetical protein